MKVLLRHQGNLGYGCDQVQGMTLGELLEAVQDAVDEFGEDTEVVTFQTNNGRGANFGSIDSNMTFGLDEEEGEF